MNPMYSRIPVQLLIKIGAFLFPLVFIYGPFTGEKRNPLAKQVRHYILAGLLFDMILLFAFVVFLRF